MGLCSYSASEQHVQQWPSLVFDLRHKQVGVYHRVHTQHGLYVERCDMPASVHISYSRVQWPFAVAGSRFEQSGR
jgi:hypothetical protein